VVLDTAERLFYERGVRSVGMDELVRETGLGKATVYRMFATKDDLVEAVLARLERRILDLVDRDLASHREEPDRALLAILDSVERSVGDTGFRGCPFHNASIEYADPGHPVRLVAARYRKRLRARLRQAGRELDPQVGTELGDRLALLIDGAYISASHLGPDGPSAAGLTLARELVRQVRAAATPTVK
jgi:AcrR family transcriptional regulator